MVVDPDVLANIGSSEGIVRFVLGSIEASVMKGIELDGIMLGSAACSERRATI